MKQHFIRFARVICLLSVIFCAPAQAAFLVDSVPESFSAVFFQNGMYSGLEIGRSEFNQNLSSFNITTDSPFSAGKVDKQEKYARAFAGVQINNNVALEVGVTHMGKIRLRKLVHNTLTNGKADIRVESGELLGKLIIPVSDQINMFAAVGLACVNINSDNTAKFTDSMGNVVKVNYALTHADNHEYTKVYGVGGTFCINPSMGVIFNWRVYEGRGDFDRTEVFTCGVIFHTDVLGGEII